MYSGAITSFRQTEDQQAEMCSLLGRSRRRRCSPASQRRLPSSTFGLRSYVVPKGRQRHSNLRRPPLGCRCLSISHGILLAAIGELPTRRQPHNAPTLHTAWTIQQVTRAEFHILEILNCELATLAPAAWVEIFGRRLSLWEGRQLLLPQHPNLLVAPPTVLDPFGVKFHGQSSRSFCLVCLRRLRGLLECDS